MKKKLIFLLLFLLGIALLICWSWKKRVVRTNNPLPVASRSPTIAPTNQNKSSAPTDKIPTTIDNVVSGLKREKQMLQEIERGKDEWRTPIEFYGKVVDENNQPVAEARVEFSCNDLSATGTSNYRTVSDSNGNFSLSGIKGKLLVVKVTKDGFYTSKRDNDSFYYAGQNVNFVPNASSPVIFHLRKRGETENLIHIASRIKIPLNGQVVNLSLLSGKLVPRGESNIQLKCLSDLQNKKANQKFDWNMTIVVPNGGIIESKDEFDFTAPETGYEPSLEIKMPADLEKGWKNTVERKFIIKMANGNYARISFLFIAYNGVFRFESFVNPSGSRNLEFDPNKVVQPNE